MVQSVRADFPASRRRSGSKFSQSVLVVDDDPEIRHMFCYLLELEGYHVREARDGVEAVQVLASEQVSVLITDLYMPRMNGFELLRLVQSAGAVPRLVAMSGVVDYQVRPSAAEAALLLATHAILDKPFTIRQLIQAIAAPETAEAAQPSAPR